MADGDRRWVDSHPRVCSPCSLRSPACTALRGIHSHLLPCTRCAACIGAAEESPDCELMLIGNKTDIADETPSAREVPTAAGVALAKELRIPFFETSAKTGANIEKSFECLSARGLARATGKPMPLLPDESPVASIATAAAPSTGGGPAVVGGPSSTLATAGAGTSSTSGASSVGAFGAASPAAWRHKSKDIDVVRIEAEAHTVAVTGGASSRGRCSC